VEFIGTQAAESRRTARLHCGFRELLEMWSLEAPNPVPRVQFEQRWL